MNVGEHAMVLTKARIYTSCFFPFQPDNSIQSVITFDQGGEWMFLRKPENAKCDSTAKNKEEVCLIFILAEIKYR